MKILQNNFLWILNTKKPKPNSVANKDLITKHSTKNYFTADHQDPDRRKCCVLLLMGATQLFQHCPPLCSDHWGSRNPGLFLRYLFGMMLQVYCLMKLLKLYNCNSFLETMLVVWTSLIKAPEQWLIFRRLCWSSSRYFTSLPWVQSAPIPSCWWQ